MTRWVIRLLDLLFRREIIGLRGQEPYLTRWIVYRRRNGAGLYVHRFIGDDSADSHDHPKHFTSIGICGSYDEEVFEPEHRWVHHRAPWFRSFPPSHRHRICLIDGEPAWTIVKVGPEIRTWGFYTPTGWVDWRAYKPGEDLRRDA